MTEAIGMMEGAFFVGRGELIAWANKTFNLNLTKIEQFGTGAVYCQILDAVHPGKVNMSKVNWKAKFEWEFINNLKLLQQCFLKCQLNKMIEIERLSKAKYQDNLEFAQWMKRYYDLKGGCSADYDPTGRRGKDVEPDFSFAEKVTHSNHHKNSNDKSFSKSKNKELRSLSPSVKYNTKRSNLLGKKIGSTNNDQENKEMEDELKRLFKNLVDMRNLTEDSKAEDKIGKIREIIDISLQSKFFKKENYIINNGKDKVLEGLKEKNN